jgi:hypothetical protein
MPLIQEGRGPAPPALPDETETFGNHRNSTPQTAKSLDLQEIVQLHPLRLRGSALAGTCDERLAILEAACLGAGRHANSAGDRELTDFWLAVMSALGRELRRRQGERPAGGER